MTKRSLRGLLPALLGGLLAVGGCSDDSTNPGPEPGPQNLPEIPVPTSVNQLMPARSDDLVIGLSEPLEEFEPLVSELRTMRDDGSLIWSAQNRHLILACPGVLPVNTGDADAPDPTYISARPRLMHTRYWRRLEQNTLSPGTSFTLTKTVTWGASTYHEESTEFSRTMGVEVEAGGSWGAFSASVKASYSQTSTYSEVEAVTFSTEESEERSYDVQAPASGTRVYVLWQLVDVFSLVDADMVPIHESPTLVHARIPAIASIEFPNQNVVTMKTTDFD